jgi:hypothetical protein
MHAANYPIEGTDFEKADQNQPTKVTSHEPIDHRKKLAEIASSNVVAVGKIIRTANRYFCPELNCGNRWT